MYKKGFQQQTDNIVLIKLCILGCLYNTQCFLFQSLDSFHQKSFLTLGFFLILLNQPISDQQIRLSMEGILFILGASVKFDRDMSENLIEKKLIINEVNFTRNFQVSLNGHKRSNKMKLNCIIHYLLGMSLAFAFGKLSIEVYIKVYRITNSND